MINYISSQLQFHIDWKIKIDPVYRLLDKMEYGRSFFETGEILLSSFEKFRKYPNEIQGDLQEGRGSIVGEDEKGNVNMLVYDSGIQAYIMSTTKEINPQIVNAFNAQCALKIHHPTLFALELSRKLFYVNSGLEGDCTYGDSKVQQLKKETESNKLFQEMKYENTKESQEILQTLTQGTELFFKLDKYRYQREHRFIWFSQRAIKDSIVIKCPEAREYCEFILLNS
jgi:hypothetical protein